MTPQQKTALFTAEYARLDTSLRAHFCRLIAKLTALDSTAQPSKAQKKKEKPVSPSTKG
ncbi:MAG: hypothetical protein LBG74_00055 [Spirochaetaceae bacterium]|jgi:hypothetical protein|nr:hypothetical protein [Spirochaetaceae bacterium]